MILISSFITSNSNCDFHVILLLERLVKIIKNFKCILNLEPERVLFFFFPGLKISQCELFGSKFEVGSLVQYFGVKMT